MSEMGKKKLSSILGWEWELQRSNSYVFPMFALVSDHSILDNMVYIECIR